MAETGVLGRLPKWPRNALNNSVIAAEQAYRKRSGLPLLSDADIEALKAGQPMSWEAGGNGASAPAAPVPAAAPPTPAPVAVAASSGDLSPEVQQQVAAGKKWSKSSIAAEQARRKRNNLAPLNDAEVAALLGEAAPPAAAPVAAPVAAAVAAPAFAGNISAEVQKQVAAGKKWSKSSIAADQARRKRNNLPPLNDAEVAALLGEPAAPAAATAAPAARPAAAAPAAPRAAAVAAGSPVARTGTPTT